MRGKLISFEGCEGSGKTTKLRMLKEFLEARGIPYLYTREPGGNPVSENIRAVILSPENAAMTPECEALLYAAARVQLLHDVIEPALAAGKLVVCDRYVDSSIAYQAFGRKLGRKRVEEINAYAFASCMPDAVVFIDMNPLNSWRRQKGKIVENDRMEKESDGFHLAVYLGFKESASSTDRFISVIPDEDKLVTASLIVNALKAKGLIE